MRISRMNERISYHLSHMTNRISEVADKFGWEISNEEKTKRAISKFRKRASKKILNELMSEKFNSRPEYPISVDWPESAEAAADYYSNNAPLSELYSREDQNILVNVRYGASVCDQAVKGAIKYYLPQILMRGEHTPDKNVINDRLAGSPLSEFYVGNIIGGTEAFNKASDKLDLSFDDLYGYEVISGAMAGELIGRSGKTVPEILDKYQRLFNASFPESAKMKERLEGIVRN